MKTFLKNIFLAIVRKIPAKDLNMKCMRTLTMLFPANRGTPEVYERINCTFTSASLQLHPKSLINILRDISKTKIFFLSQRFLQPKRYLKAKIFFSPAKDFSQPKRCLKEQRSFFSAKDFSQPKRYLKTKIFFLSQRFLQPKRYLKEQKSFFSAKDFSSRKDISKNKNLFFSAKDFSQPKRYLRNKNLFLSAEKDLSRDSKTPIKRS